MLETVRWCLCENVSFGNVCCLCVCVCVCVCVLAEHSEEVPGWAETRVGGMDKLFHRHTFRDI